MTPLGVAIDLLARDNPAAPAITCNEVTLTRRELASRTNRLARALQAKGVRPGDLVTLALPTGTQFLETTVAVWKLGATPQPVSHRLPPAELRSILGLAQARLVVGDIDAWERVETVGSTYSGWTQFPDEPLPPVAAPSWKAPTSGGSTGTPKLIISTRPGVVASVTGIAPLARIDGNTTALITGPLYHNGPLQYATTTLLLGGHVVLMDRFDALKALRCIERHRVTWLYQVPTMMLRLHRLGDELERADLSSLQTLFHLAAPCPSWLKKAWIERLGAERILELYGGTEGQAATLVTGSEWLARPGTVGRAVVGEIAVFDAGGLPVSPGTSGEVYLRASDGPTYRYIGAQPRSLGDGWESLGDMGWMDQDGYLYLSDRSSDMIVVGGANVYPAEVEGALEEHSAVVSACVIGLPDPEYGSTVHAIINVVAHVSDAELAAHLSSRLVSYKWPRSYERVAEPLRDDTGKVRRSALRAERVERIAAASSGTAIWGKKEAGGSRRWT